MGFCSVPTMMTVRLSVWGRFSGAMRALKSRIRRVREGRRPVRYSRPPHTLTHTQRVQCCNSFAIGFWWTGHSGIYWRSWSLMAWWLVALPFEGSLRVYVCVFVCVGMVATHWQHNSIRYRVNCWLSSLPYNSTKFVCSVLSLKKKQETWTAYWPHNGKLMWRRMGVVTADWRWLNSYITTHAGRKCT